MNTNTLLKNGKVSAYGFGCGYKEGIETATLYKELYMEHGVYHVRSTVHNTPSLNTKFNGQTSHLFTIWESFYKVSEARALYNKIK